MMIHKKIGEITQTNEYDLFKRLDGNRALNPAHYKRLKKSIEEESLTVPIIVNENFEIIDGQNRYKAWRELDLPIIYIKITGYGLPQVQRLNSNIRNWSLDDYANSYCSLGNMEYFKYLEFRKKYGLGHYDSIAMLTGNISGRGFERFRTGSFKIKSYKKACEEADKIMQVEEYYEGYKRRSFVFAMLHLINHPNYNHIQLLNKLKYQRTKLVHCSNKGQYLALIQDIYNFKSSDKVNLLYKQ